MKLNDLPEIYCFFGLFVKEALPPDTWFPRRAREPCPPFLPLWRKYATGGFGVCSIGSEPFGSETRADLLIAQRGGTLGLGAKLLLM